VREETGKGDLIEMKRAAKKEQNVSTLKIKCEETNEEDRDSLASRKKGAGA